jgi:hypothetical protein
MMDEELKDNDILIDGKEAKRQFLEELRNKNEEENKKIEESKSEENKEEEEKRKFLEEIKIKSQEENNELEDNKELEIKNKETIDNEEDDNKDNINEEEINEIIDGEDSEENKIEESHSLDLISDENSNKKKKGFLGGVLKASLIDTAVTALVSLLGVYLFDEILRLLFGYYVVDFKGVYIILFLIILVFYPVIMQRSKDGKTLGNKFSKMQMKEREE